MSLWARLVNVFSPSKEPIGTSHTHILIHDPEVKSVGVKLARSVMCGTIVIDPSHSVITESNGVMRLVGIEQAWRVMSNLEIYRCRRVLKAANNVQHTVMLVLSHTGYVRFFSFRTVRGYFGDIGVFVLSSYAQAFFRTEKEWIDKLGFHLEEDGLMCTDL